jgi:ABC-type multidrug transport system fused ATPase/permease subunit
MVFLGLVITAIILYVKNYKVLALFILFFFLTTGFNLVPEEITKFAFISKGIDYAILILFGVILIDTLFVKDYLKPDKFAKCLIVFGIFLMACILYSKLVVGLSWIEIIRTCRYQFFWIAYFVFRNMTKRQLEILLKCLYTVTAFCSALFILQIFVHENILLKFGYTSAVTLFGVVLPRYYNQPDMIHLFALMSIFCNPFKQPLLRLVTTIILVAALLGAFHRSLIGFFMLALLVGYVVKLPRLKRIIVVSVLSFIAGFIFIFGSYLFVHSRTYADFKKVLSGNIADADIDITDLSESTFTFRIAHLWERNQYLLEHPKAMILGAGLIPENSKKVESLFDFDIGLIEELTGQTTQLDTADISYSLMLIRMGYLGTLLNVLLFIYLMVFFYRKRENKYALTCFLFFVMSFGVSFFSWNLALAITYILPLICYNIVKKSETEDEDVTEKSLSNE